MREGTGALSKPVPFSSHPSEPAAVCPIVLDKALLFGRAHAGSSKLALALEASRTMRVQTIDLVIATRELRRAAGR